MNTPPGAPPPQGPPPGFPPPGPPPQGFAPPGAPPHGFAPPGPPPGTAPPAAPADPAKSAAIMLVVAAVVMLIGLFSKSWASAGAGGEGVNFGPMGAEICRGGMCVDVPGETMKLPGDVEAIRILALIGGFAAIGMAGFFGVMSLLGKRDKLPAVKLANMAFGIGAFGMTFFVVRVLIEGKGVSPSWAGFVAVGGVITASIGLKKLTPFLPAAPPAHAPVGGHHPAPPMAPPPYGPPMGGQHASQPMAQPPYGQQVASQPMPPQPYAQPQPQPMAPPMMAPSPMAPPPAMAPPQMAAPHAPPPQQFCPRCGTPAQYVAQHQRWFCPREQQYI